MPNGRSLIVKASGLLRDGGPVALLRMVSKNLRWQVRRFFDARFDRRLGINTADEVFLEDLAIDSPNKRLGRHYVPTRVATFRHLMSYLPRSFGEFTFIDLGCGKGRILAAALDYGFRRIVGVEFSGELCADAERNMAAVVGKGTAWVEVVHADAANFQFPDGDCVLYLFHSFEKPLLEQVLDNIGAWYSRSPRTLYLVYLNCEPEYADFIIARLGFMRPIAEGSCKGQRRKLPFVIFAGSPER